MRAASGIQAGAVPADVRLERWLTVGLGAWAVGVQTLEPVAATGMAMCALAALWSARGRGLEAGRDFLRSWWPIALFMGWSILAPSLALHPPSGTGVARTLDFVGIPLAAWSFSRISAGQRLRVLTAAACVLLLSCGAATLQHFGIWPSGDELRALSFLRIPIDRMYEPVPGTTDRFMAGGLLFHRLKFAHVGGLAVIVLGATGMATAGRPRAFLLGSAALALGAILAFPFARAASAALIVSCALVIVLSMRRRRIALLLGAGLVLVAGSGVLVYAPLRERFLRSASADGNGDRELLLGAGVKALTSHPITGLGPGRFKVGQWVPPDAPVPVREHVGKSHNQFLSMSAETGIPGALLFALMLFALARRIDLSGPAGVASAGALCFFVLLSLVHDPLFHSHFSMALPLVLGPGMRRPKENS
jgi:O-antigen ligase